MALRVTERFLSEPFCITTSNSCRGLYGSELSGGLGPMGARGREAVWGLVESLGLAGPVDGRVLRHAALQLGPEVADEPLHRPRRAVPQRADRVP